MVKDMGRSSIVLGFLILFLTILVSCKTTNNLSKMSGSEEHHSPIFLYVPSLETIYISVPDTYTKVETCLSSSKACEDTNSKVQESILKKDGRVFYKVENSDKLRFIQIKALTLVGELEELTGIKNSDTNKEVDEKDNENDLTKDNNNLTKNDVIVRVVELKDKTNESSTKVDEENKDPKITSYEGYGCYDTTQDVCKAEYTIFVKTNELRKSFGLKELKPNIALSYLARQWSVEQARQGNISHNWFTSGITNQKFNALKKSSFHDSSVISFLSAENVAANMGYTEGTAVGTALYSQWRNSPGHYANMVGSHNYMGVGVVIGAKSTYSIYGTQLFGR